MSNRWEQIATICAAVGLVVTGYFSWKAQQTADQSLRIARDAHAVGELAYRSTHASKFFLGEVPPSLGQGPGPEYAAINANPIDIYSVWVEGKLNDVPAIARIWTVQACTGYRFPLEFEPNVLYFFDGTNSWIRRSDGELVWTPDKKPVPSAGDNIETYTFDAAGCA